MHILFRWATAALLLAVQPFFLHGLFRTLFAGEGRSSVPVVSSRVSGERWRSSWSIQWQHNRSRSACCPSSHAGTRATPSRWRSPDPWLCASIRYWHWYAERHFGADTHGTGNLSICKSLWRGAARGSAPKCCTGANRIVGYEGHGWNIIIGLHVFLSHFIFKYYLCFCFWLCNINTPDLWITTLI